MSELVRADGVTVWVGTGQVLLAPTDLVVAAGERWVVLGANGAGKSTLLDCLAAIRQPSAGRLVLLGGLVGRTDLRELRRRIGLVDTRTRVPADYRVAEVVLSGIAGTVALRPQQVTELLGTHAGRVEEVLAATGLAGFADRAAGTLSQGETARLRLARALAGRPELVLLDEPAGGLDLGGREQLIEVLDGPDAGSWVLVTHHPEEIPASATHALVLRTGKVLASGPRAEVLTATTLSQAFGLALEVRDIRGRVSVHPY